MRAQAAQQGRDSDGEHKLHPEAAHASFRIWLTHLPPTQLSFPRSAPASGCLRRDSKWRCRQGWLKWIRRMVTSVERRMRSGKRTLRIRVNEDLTLDAGWWEEAPADDGVICRWVHPPARTLFQQVVDYLESVPLGSEARGPRSPEFDLGREAVAATAVCLRWGSYLAVLADRDKPLWSRARQAGLSRIADSEMARINVEASAALAQWLDLMRNDWDRYRSLMWAAGNLPMTRRRVTRDRSSPLLLTLAQPELAARVVASAQEQRLRRARHDVEAHPTRVLANAIILSCWRNGPIEDVHAGLVSDYPLTQRRITPAEEHTLVGTVAGRLAQAVLAAEGLIREESDRTWAERVLPFRLSPVLTPKSWSLEESTRQVRLDGAESPPFAPHVDELSGKG
jgi:hypothetical protein